MPKTQTIPKLTAEIIPGLYWIKVMGSWVIGEYVEYNGEFKWFYANTVRLIKEIEVLIPERIKTPDEETH